ncbi:MAG: universal stress protein [Saprospiraceae bacterium]|nr:universal stress protein [Saprospiraceae bacterium]
MKTVFLPTDFSEASKQGLHYGLALAPTLFPNGVRFVLFHVYHLNIPGGEFEHVYADDNIQKEESEARIQELLEELKALYPDLQIETKVAYGYASNAIVEQSEKEKADLLIIASKHRTTFDRIMQGSNTRRIAYQSNCPVLIVPEECGYQKIEKVLFATDFQIDNLQEQISFLKYFVKVYDPEIKTLHLHGKDETDLSVKAAQSEKIFDLLGSKKYSHFFLEHEAVAKGITDFTEGYQADLLVLTHHDRGMVESVFHRSLTKQLIDKINIPLLILHSNAGKGEDLPFDKKVHSQLEKWRGELDELRVQAHLGKKLAGEKWDTQKDAAQKQLDSLKERLKGTPEIAEDKWDNFKSEIGAAFQHVKKAFAGSKELE